MRSIRSAAVYRLPASRGRVTGTWPTSSGVADGRRGVLEAEEVGNGELPAG
jgi:hypothetical protein